MKAEERDIRLIDVLNVLWRRKWLIILPTVMAVLSAGVISFLLPRKWEVDAVIQPSKFFVQTGQGQFVEVVVVAPRQIAGQINQESYNPLIAAEIDLDVRDCPKPRAEHLPDTNLVRVSVRDRDVDRGKAVLNSLFNHLKRELDRKIDVEIKSLDTEIFKEENAIRQNELDIEEIENQIDVDKLEIQDKENDIKTTDNEIKKLKNDMTLKELDVQFREIDKEVVKKEIEAEQNKLKISEERVQSILEERKAVKARIDEIDEQQRKAMAENKQGTDAISLLLYSNEIQQNLRYYNTLDEKWSAEKVTQENHRLNVWSKQERLRQLDTQIRQLDTQKDSIAAEIDNMITRIAVIRTDIEKTLNETKTLRNEIAKARNTITERQSQIRLLGDKKARIDHALLIKEPTSSIFPVSPRKKLIVLLTGLAGLFLFTILAFFLDYVEKEGRNP